MVKDGDNSTAVNPDLLPSRLSHVEVLEWRVAPPSVVVRKGIVRRAKVGSSDRHGPSFDAPCRISFGVANDLKALPA